MPRWRKRPTGRNRTFDRLGAGPNWLWFWLILYVATLPWQVANRWLPLLQGMLLTGELPGEALSSMTTVLRGADLAELLPLWLVALGVASVALPGLRGRRIGSVYRLDEPPRLSSIDEMRAFVAEHAPGVVVRANVLRSDGLAIAYPVGWRRYAIGIFGPMAKLWVRDRAVAEAILLHEAAHICRGDTLAVGAGSFIRFLLDRWLLVILLAVVAPVVGIWSVDAARFLVGDSLATLEARLGHKLVQLLTLALPHLLKTTTALMIGAVSTITLPLVAIWAAELAADAQVVGSQKSNSFLLRALDTLTGAKSWRQRLAFGLSHPSLALRRASVVRSRGRAVRALALLALPCGYVVRGVLLLGRAAIVYAGQLPIAEIGARLAAHARMYAAAIAPVWLAMAGYLVVWPWIAGVWAAIWCGHGTREAQPRTDDCLWAAAVVLTLAFLVWLL